MIPSLNDIQQHPKHIQELRNLIINGKYKGLFEFDLLVDLYSNINKIKQYQPGIQSTDTYYCLYEKNVQIKIFI